MLRKESSTFLRVVSQQVREIVRWMWHESIARDRKAGWKERLDYFVLSAAWRAIR